MTTPAEIIAVPKELLPLRFGFSAGVREWEARRSIEELRDGLRDEGITVLSDEEMEEIYAFARDLCDSDSFTPDMSDTLFPLYSLIFDETQEPREAPPTMEELAKAYTGIQATLADFQRLIFRLFDPFFP